MKLNIFIIIAFLYSHATAEEMNCAQEALIQNGAVTTYAKEFRDSYFGVREKIYIEKHEAVSIAQNYMSKLKYSEFILIWGSINVDNYWVVRFSPCSDPWVRGGAGMLLVSPQERKVVHTFWER